MIEAPLPVMPAVPRKPRAKEAKPRSRVERAPTLPPVVGLVGPIGAGKTTAALALAERAGFEILPFAAPLKRMLAALGVPERHLTGSQDDKAAPLALLGGKSAREALQTLGTEWGRALISPTLWVDAWRLAAAGRSVIADDVRFANEAAAIRALGGVVVRIDRAGLPRRQGHASEALDFAADIAIANDGSRADLGRRLRAALAEHEKRSRRRRGRTI